MFYDSGVVYDDEDDDMPSLSFGIDGWSVARA